MESKRSPRAGKRSALLAVLAVMLVVAASTPLALSGTQQAQAQTGSARIVRSADGVLLRTEPTYGAEVLTTLSEGSEVGLRTHEFDTVYDADGVTRWWPVSSDIGDGWVAGFYLEIDGLTPEATSALSNPPPDQAASNADQALETGAGSSTINPPSGPPPGPTEDVFLAGPYARVAEPEGVNLRTNPGSGAESLRSLSFDTVVEIRTNEADTTYVDGARWWPVRIDGQDGWIIGTYLAAVEDVAQAVPPDAPAAAAPPAAPDLADVPAAQEAAADLSAFETVFGPGSYVAAVTDDGSGLNIRADGAPDAERIGSIPDNDVVQVMDGPFLDPLGNGWYLVTDGMVTGFVDGGWLAAASQPASPNDDFVANQPPAPDAPPLNAAGLATGSIGLPLTDFTLTQPFGCSPYWWWYPWDANLGCHVHDALDMAAPMYTPLYAADGGVVEYAGWCDCGLGYYVKIDHLNGFKTTYGHMADQPIVQTGQAVSKGQEIGPIGSSGTSTGSHVHFMLELNGYTVDPLAYAQ